jgi:ankyrin repeat protein
MSFPCFVFYLRKHTNIYTWKIKNLCEMLTPLIDEILDAGRANNESIVRRACRQYPKLFSRLIPASPNTLLHFFSLRGYHECLRAALKLDLIDVNVQNEDGFSAVALAAQYGNEETIRMLAREFHASVHTPVDDFSRTQKTPLSLAIEQGHVDAVRVLVNECNINVSNLCSRCLNPLETACKVGHLDIAKILVHECGASVNAIGHTGRSPLTYATENDHLKLVRLLIFELGAHYDSHLLFVALEYNARKTVQFLFGLVGIDPTFRNLSGDNALHVAARWNHDEIAIQALIDHKHMQVNSVNHKGQSALFIACIRSNAIAVCVLLKARGVDRTLVPKTSTGNTLVHVAAAKKSIRVLEALIVDPDIDVNVQNNDGETALMKCMTTNSDHIVGYLVWKRKCNIFLKDKDGNTAHDKRLQCSEKIQRIIENAVKHHLVKTARALFRLNYKIPNEIVDYILRHYAML